MQDFHKESWEELFEEIRVRSCEHNLQTTFFAGILEAVHGKKSEDVCIPRGILRSQISERILSRMSIQKIIKDFMKNFQQKVSQSVSERTSKRHFGGISIRILLKNLMKIF